MPQGWSFLDIFKSNHDFLQYKDVNNPSLQETSKSESSTNQVNYASNYRQSSRGDPRYFSNRNSKARGFSRNKQIECWRCFQYGHSKAQCTSVPGQSSSITRGRCKGRHLTRSCKVSDAELRAKFESGVLN